MKIRTLPLILLSLVLAGCNRPVPPEKSAYVGEWQEKSMYLLITQDGSVTYRRVQDGRTTSINAPLKGFKGNDFDVGVGAIATTFVVDKPPYLDGDVWKMVVDGQALAKTAD